MHYHIILTEKCDSECRYCYKKSIEEFDNQLDKKFNFEFSSPCNSEIDIQKLKKFIEKDKEPVVIFYGGEPLLNINKIKEIIEALPENTKYRMQTNGKLLNKLPMQYLKKIDKILISIDGTKQRTDYNRGEGNYKLVIDNINQIKKLGWKGEIIARMTISQEFPDVYEQAKHIIEKTEFGSIHWQLDAGFYKFDFNKEKFKKFVKEYNQSVSTFIDYWIKEMHKGKVLMIYPFVGIALDIITGKETKLRCGAGHSGYAIITNGKIVACPIMNNIKEFEAGSLESSPEELKKFDISRKCLLCSYLKFCGGRCLYWNKADLWPLEGDELICQTIKHLIDEIKNKIPEIQSLIDKKAISIKDLEYEKYFGPEIIP